MQLQPNNEVARIVVATKELVDELLAMNTHNRNAKPGVVARYKRDILADRWYFTNQGIGVSYRGVLLDGQHRLLAIRECGYPPVKLLIVYGLADEAQMAVDQHSKRSARDWVGFAFGPGVTKHAPAIATVIHKDRRDWKGGPPTMQEIYDIIVDYAEEIELVVSSIRNQKFFAAPHLAAFVMAVRRGHGPAVVKFIGRVMSGELLTKSMPEFHLRNFIMTQRNGSGGSWSQIERLRKTEKALNYYIEGRPMGVLRV